MRFLRTVALAAAFTLVPACAALPIASPVAAAPTPELKAYAALESYRAALEEAADLAARPETPRALITALAVAERTATPAAEALYRALVAHLAAQAALARDPMAAEAAALAAIRLNGALQAASGPLTAFTQTLGRR